MHYRYQARPGEITAWTDSDFAGCMKSRKSTSAGVIMLGTHLIKTWSTNQAVIALSSGEAEYYSLVRAGSVALGMESLLRDLGMQDTGKIALHTDASAAIGISNRIGIGKVRHIEVNQLWLQEKVAAGKFQVIKVPTDSNLADAFTKGVDMTRHSLAPTCDV